MYEGILKYLFKGEKSPWDGRTPHQQAETFAFNHLKSEGLFKLETRGKVNYGESVIPARRQIIVESHPQIWGEGITCSWNVLSAGIFNDSTWCITTGVVTM